jgi:hypothetical protein
MSQKIDFTKDKAYKQTPEEVVIQEELEFGFPGEIVDSRNGIPLLVFCSRIDLIKGNFEDLKLEEFNRVKSMALIGRLKTIIREAYNSICISSPNPRVEMNNKLKARISLSRIAKDQDLSLITNEELILALKTELFQALRMIQDYHTSGTQKQRSDNAELNLEKHNLNQRLRIIRTQLDRYDEGVNTVAAHLKTKDSIIEKKTMELQNLAKKYPNDQRVAELMTLLEKVKEGRDKIVNKFKEQCNPPKQPKSQKPPSNAKNQSS